MDSLQQNDVVSYRNYNKYSQTIKEYEAVTAARRRSSIAQDDVLLTSLPVNRTLLFDCYDAEAGLCVEARFSVTNFRADSSPILITVNFTIDLARVGRFN